MVSEYVQEAVECMLTSYEEQTHEYTLSGDELSVGGVYLVIKGVKTVYEEELFEDELWERLGSSYGVINHGHGRYEIHCL